MGDVIAEIKAYDRESIAAGHRSHLGALANRAATEIATLRAEVERLRAQREDDAATIRRMRAQTITLTPGADPALKAGMGEREQRQRAGARAREAEGAARHAAGLDRGELVRALRMIHRGLSEGDLDTEAWYAAASQALYYADKHDAKAAQRAGGEETDHG